METSKNRNRLPHHRSVMMVWQSSVLPKHATSRAIGGAVTHAVPFFPLFIPSDLALF
jgi:hypothetical protein